MNETLKNAGGLERVEKLKFKKKLGSGGQGEVFLVKIQAKDSEGNGFNKKFALKKCPKKQYQQKH